MVRRFSVSTPDDLDSLSEFLRNGRLNNVARVWRVAKKQGKTAFDGLVFVVFSTDKPGVREATVIRLGLDGGLNELATLKYNLALGWCSTHLMPVYP